MEQQVNNKQVIKKKTKPWRTSMIAISPHKLASTDPEIIAWVAKRKEMIKQSLAYQPKQSRRDRRKRSQAGA